MNQVATRDAPASLATQSGVRADARRDLTGALNALLADVFALLLKTKNFHWHISGPHFRDYHVMLDEQAGQLVGTIDVIAERVRKIGGTTIRSKGHVVRVQRVLDNNAVFVDRLDMLAELRDHNGDLARRLGVLHGLCDEYEDFATASLIESWIDEAGGRRWFLFESTRNV